MLKKKGGNQIMKKIVPIILALSLALALVSCGDSTDQSSTPETNTSISDTSETIENSDPVNENSSDESETSTDIPDVSQPDDESKTPDESVAPETVILDYTDYFKGASLYDFTGNEEDQKSPFRFGGTWNIKRAEDGTYDLTVKVTIDCTSLKMRAKTVYVTIDGTEYKFNSKEVDVAKDSDAVRYLVVTLGQVQTKAKLDENGNFSANVSVKLDYNGTYGTSELKTIEFSETITVK